MTFPALLGSGKRLFGAGSPPLAFRLVEQTATPSGAVIATYEPAGGIASGWAGPPVTSAREQVRQRRMAEGSW
jgi:hypothetical protein